jgi:glycosyltransferase involved in cell wall biosynthesis
VVVVDDGSEDDTSAVLTAERERGDLDLHTLRNERPRGPAAARNAGWRAASAPFVAFTDDDCTVVPHWLEAGLAAWEGASERIVQGRTDPQPSEVAGEGPFTRTLRVHSLGPSYQTCNVFYPRALLEQVDGFDEETFTVPGGEDADLAWRCIEGGAESVFAPRAQAYHAVQYLGPLGKIKVAWRWHETMVIYARHAGIRETMTYRIFWKKSHYVLLRAGLGFLLPRRLRLLRWWFQWPVYTVYIERARGEGMGRLWSAPYFVVHDIVELIAAVRGAIRYRTPVL